MNNLDKIGEQTISYMEKVSQYKKNYESQSIKNKPPFINLTIGGVYRKTKPQKDYHIVLEDILLI